MKPMDKSARMSEESRIIVVGKPLASQGVGEALRSAYRPSAENLPRDIADCLARLN